MESDSAGWHRGKPVEPAGANFPSQVPASSAGDASPRREATRLGEISAVQWKSGIAAWLGWLFDGLDMHLYTLVASPLSWN